FATVPTWRACDSALSHGPEGDRLLGGLHIALLRELTYGDGAVSTVMLPWSILAAVMVALLWNPFVSGGVLSVLQQEPGSRGDGFFGGGVRYYGRLTRVLLAMVAIGGIVVAIVGSVLFGIQSAVSEGGYEWPSFILILLNLAILAALAGLLSLITDYARIGIVRDG